MEYGKIRTWGRNSDEDYSIWVAHEEQGDRRTHLHALCWHYGREET